MADNWSHNSVPVSQGAVLLASEARTASGEKKVTGYGWARFYTFVLDVTAAATAADDTLNVYVQRELPNGDRDDIVSFTQVLGNGGAKVFVADITTQDADGDERAPSNAALTAGSVVNAWLGDTIWVKWVIVDADTDDASFTFGVTVNARG